MIDRDINIVDKEWLNYCSNKYKETPTVLQRHRDKKDFAIYWKLLGIGETDVKYHADLDFKPKPNSLIICDEADKFMIEVYAKFSGIIRECFCICFTGTPDNCDANGIQKYMIDNL
jgi:hypothetical protein